MERITITIDEALLNMVDGMVSHKGYESRSEAIRDILRSYNAGSQLENLQAQAVGTLTFVFDHGVRELADRLSTASHANHDIIVSSNRSYLNHDSCLEVIVLRGTVGKLQQFALALSTQRGIRNANLHLLPATLDQGDPSHEHQHLHI